MSIENELANDGESTDANKRVVRPIEFRQYGNHSCRHVEPTSDAALTSCCPPLCTEGTLVPEKLYPGGENVGLTCG